MFTDKAKKYMDKKAKEYEEYLGVDNFEEWLRYQYLEEFQSYRQIMKKLNTKSNRSIAKFLKYYGIPIRRGGEAVKTQWIDNPERKKEQAERIRKIATGNTIQRKPLSHFQKMADVFNLELIDRKIIEGNSYVKYRCRDCGFIDWKDTANLVKGCNSSECNLVSKGELFTERYLKSKGIEYKAQYSFEDCKHIQVLLFDFAIFKDNKVVALIEYQGIQHYEPVEAFGGASEWEVVRARDKIKSDYAAENNIPLIKIPYIYKTPEEINNYLDKHLII